MSSKTLRQPPEPRAGAAVLAARCAGRASALLGRGGTSLPGLVGLYLEPNLVRKLAAQLGRGSLVVAGTNGKTTTAALTAAALRSGGHRLAHNRAGSNMLRGVATTLARRAAWTGHLPAGPTLTGLFEVDEAAFASVVAQLNPRAIVITNLFRDQLDRYAEIAMIAERWREAISSLSADTSLVLNADDPLVASLATAAPGAVSYYGVERWPEEQVETAVPVSSADSLFCPRCAAPLLFSVIAYAHLGHYHCAACGLRRPGPGLSAVVESVGADGSDMIIRSEANDPLPLRIALPGRYNVYNALAALAGSRAAGVELGTAAAAVGAAQGVFGRAETVSVDGRTVRLFLIKNPTGADAVLDVIASGSQDHGLLCLLSDNAADGHDISWIWDVRFETLDGWAGPVFCGGTRGEDMALRLKYAGLPEPAFVVPANVPRTVRDAIAATPQGGTLIIVATYTAMLAARDTLARDGHVRQFWRSAS